MAINFVRTLDGSDDSIRFQPMERLKVYLFGATVLFASFGMGEAVYRLLFSEFDGATDRIPVEVLFGLVFAWLATKFGAAFTEIARRGAPGSTPFGLGIIKYEMLWKDHSVGPPIEKPTIDQSLLSLGLELGFSTTNFTGVSEPTLSCNQLPLSSIRGHRRSDWGVSRRLD
jgi:hypothetical protein